MTPEGQGGRDLYGVSKEYRNDRKNAYRVARRLLFATANTLLQLRFVKKTNRQRIPGRVGGTTETKMPLQGSGGGNGRGRSGGDRRFRALRPGSGRVSGGSYPGKEAATARPNEGRGISHDVVLWEKRRKIRKLTIVVYFSLAKASDRIRPAIGTVDEAIRIPVIGNKRRTNAAQPGKLRPKPYPLRVVSLGNPKWVP